MFRTFSVRRRGSTFVEALLVIAIIAILVMIVYVAVNPGKQVGESRNAQRKSDLSAIMNAVYQFYLDKGKFPDGIPVAPAPPKEICRDKKFSAHRCNPSQQVLLDAFSGAYLPVVPEDPERGNAAFRSLNAGSGSYYFIVQDAEGRISVSAPGGEMTDGSGDRTSITVTR